jgi:GNAT superfamily N-acetyltransferase
MDTRYETDLAHVDWAEMKAAVAADNFDNGRSPQQLRESFENSFAAVVAYAGDRIVGTARVLSDGVCNAYLIDVWTLTPFRHRGVATAMVRLLLDKLPGQHVYTFTDDVVGFYKKLGFVERPTGLEIVVGQWLSQLTTLASGGLTQEEPDARRSNPQGPACPSDGSPPPLWCRTVRRPCTSASSRCGPGK